jgi:predicted aspartyl protease
MRYLLAISLVAALSLLAFGSTVGAEEGGQSGSRTTVIDDRVPVYPRMAVSGSVVHELSKGDTVTVQFELEKSSRSWCSIIYQGATTVSGYVECRHLKRQKQLQWERVEPSTSGGNAPSGYLSTTAVRLVNRQVLVPVTLNYRGVEIPVQMLMDTGASGTVIKEEVARRLGMNLDDAVIVKAVVVGGGTIDVKVAQLTNMVVGPHRVESPIIGVIEHEGAPVNFDGILGMDFLGSVEYQVDLNRKVITWTR